MTDADCPFDEWWTIMELGRLIKSNKIGNRKITFSYGWNLISKFMVWLENTEFSAKKAGKRPLFDETWLEFQILYQSTLCLGAH